MPARSEEVRRNRKRLRRLADGDVSALGEIYDSYAERLFAHAMWMTRCRQDAEDIVQDSLVKLAGLGPDLLRIRRLEPYLFSIVHRRALDLVMRRKDTPETMLEEAHGLTEKSDPARGAKVRQIEDLVCRLDPLQREVLYLHLFEGFTFRQIGKMTGVSLFTAASRYRLAIDHLREGIGGHAPTSSLVAGDPNRYVKSRGVE